MSHRSPLIVTSVDVLTRTVIDDARGHRHNRNACIVNAIFGFFRSSPFAPFNSFTHSLSSPGALDPRRYTVLLPAT